MFVFVIIKCEFSLLCMQRKTRNRIYDCENNGGGEENRPSAAASRSHTYGSVHSTFATLCGKLATGNFSYRTDSPEFDSPFQKNKSPDTNVSRLFLVEARRIELLSENHSPQLSTGVVVVLVFRTHTPNNGIICAAAPT